MKFTAFFLFFTAVLYGQSVNGKPLKDINVEYARIVGETIPFKQKIFIILDFGMGDKETEVIDENGKPVEFVGMIDALNFMVKNGFEFVQAYGVNNGSSSIYSYLIRRIKNPSSGTERLD